MAQSAFAPPGAAAPPAVSSAALGAADTGDTAWMLISTALVMLMVPGLALFYGGMVRRKNVLGTMMHSMAALGIVGLEWVILGYAMAFGQLHGGANKIIGWDSQLLFLRGVTPGMIHTGTHIPELVFIMFQGMFAIITPALIAGAFAERVKFSGYVLFTLLWSILIYNPLAHWVWGGGWLGAGAGNIGALDFAGGTVVHISAGFSALVTALYLGKRIGYPSHVLQPNSLVLTLLGAGLLWFGWFGFNGGSAGGSNGLAAVAFTATQVAAAAGAIGWLVAEWIKHGRPTSLGVASGLVAGLVAITPASGFVSPGAAIIIGLLAGVICYIAVLAKAKLGYDDSLDAFGVHGIGGFLGALLTGIFCSTVFNPDGANASFHQFGSQILAASSAAAYAAIGTLLLVVLTDKLVGFRVSRTTEIEGLDAAIHGEQGWMLEQVPVPAVELPGTAAVDNEAAATARRRDPAKTH
ncbi:MAG TPA: ammonium transporter [Phycisphaerae bacterium]|nr:ammonium transporter [Phycisphaerae bacterium]